LKIFGIHVTGIVRARLRKITRNILCVALILPVFTMQQTRAEELIHLTAVDAYAPTASWVRVFIDYFLPEVNRRLAEKGNYRIKWNKAFGGTIAKTKGVLEALQYDLADIGIITTPFHPDKIPFYNLGYVTPFVTTDIGLVARTISELAERYPEVQKIWDDYNQVYLTTTGMIDTYQLLLSEKPESLQSLRGKKIGGVGINLRYLEGLQATGVTSGLNDWYNNLATGMLSGVIAWAEAIVAYKLYEVAPYMLDVRLGAVTSMVVSVNRRTWERLPAEVREVLVDTVEDYREELARDTDRLSQESRDEFERRGGTIVPLTEEQRRQWAKRLPNLALEWAAEMEQRGLPGRQILRDYMDIMRATRQPIVRHWDRE